MTSPPYWGLRDYGVEGQIGTEKDFSQYLVKIVETFCEVRRVLRPDGTLWLNLGDRFYKKQLFGLPWRVALLLASNGWYLRSDIIWHKPNPMPESVRDRPTKSHEYVFLMTKSARYFYDAEVVKEKSKKAWNSAKDWKSRQELTAPELEKGADMEKQRTRGFGTHHPDKIQTGRNLRDVWTISTQPCKEAHFATFPERLVIPCIKAGTSEHGCCPECGAPWKRIIRKGELVKTNQDCGNTRPYDKTVAEKAQTAGAALAAGGHVPGHQRETQTLGWEPTCQCYKQGEEGCFLGPGSPIPCTVLDPFAGSGTVGLVAQRLGRDAILIDLDPKNKAITERRGVKL
jgi:DNA modification methylase